jgi:DNA repair exonuclease SbcCD ATPase subunit
MKSANIPLVAESKDEIIRNLQKEVNDLAVEREFLRKTVQDMMKDSFDIKQQHLNELRKAQEEVFDLRFRQVLNRHNETRVHMTQAEPILEAEAIDSLLLPLQNENQILQNEIKNALRENARLNTEIKKLSENKHELENLLEQKEIRINSLSELVEQKSTEVGILLKKNNELQASKQRLPKPIAPRSLGSGAHTIRRYSAPTKYEAADFSSEF